MPDSHLHGYVKNYLQPLKLGRTAHDVLQEFIDIDVTADDLVRILKNNPSYHHLFEKFVNSKAPKKAEEAASDKKDLSSNEKMDSTPTHRLISLLGLIGSRNFILALRLIKASTGNFPITAEGSMDFKPSDHLKFALDAEDLCQRNNIDYGETWFASAYLYDWLNALAKRSPNYKKLEPFIQQTWKQARATAAISHALAQRVKNLPFHKYAAAAGMTSHAGKILLALGTENSSPSYTTEVEKASKLNWRPPPEAEMLFELDNYAITHEELSALTLLSFRVFKDLEKAVRYQNEPYFLKNVDKNSYQLACLINLATLMARSWKTPADEKDPVFQEWKKPWLKDLKLTAKDVIESIRWAMTLK